MMINTRFTKLQVAALALLLINCIWLIHYGTRFSKQQQHRSLLAQEDSNIQFFEKKHKNEIANQVLNSMNFDQLIERLYSLERVLSSSQNKSEYQQQQDRPSSLLSAPAPERWPKAGLSMESNQVRKFLQEVYSAKKSKSVLPHDTWFSEDPETARIAETKLISELSEAAGVPETRVWIQPDIEVKGNYSIESSISAFPSEHPWPNSQGFIFIVGSAYGQQTETFLYLKELIFACASIKNKSPQSNITLIATPTVIQKLNQAFGATQIRWKKPIIDHVFDFYKLVHAVGEPMREEILRRTRYLPWPHGGYIIKTIGMLLTPYEKTIFLDTDVFFCEKPDPLFTVLDRFDASATDDVFRHWGSTLTPGFPSSAKSVMYDINGGLLAYKWNGYVTKWLIDTVAEFHSRHYPGMQGVLSGLIWAAEDLNFWLLGKEWNCHLVKTHCGDKWGESRYAIPCRMLHAHSLVDDKDPPEDGKNWKDFPMPEVRRLMFAIM